MHTTDLLVQKDRQEKLQTDTKVLDSVIDKMYTFGSLNSLQGDIEMKVNITMTREIILEIFK